MNESITINRWMYCTMSEIMPCDGNGERRSYGTGTLYYYGGYYYQVPVRRHQIEEDETARAVETR